MKNIILIAVLSSFLFGCNMNPSKEARIQKLEAELQKTLDNVKKLDTKIQTLESINAAFKTRVIELEKQYKLLGNNNSAD